LPINVDLGGKTLSVWPAASNIEHHNDKEPTRKRHVIVAQHRQLLSVQGGDIDKSQNTSDKSRIVRIVFTTTSA